MTTSTCRTFSPGFRLEAAQLMVEQNYLIRKAATTMVLGHSTKDKWVRKLSERGGKVPQSSAITPE